MPIYTVLHACNEADERLRDDRDAQQRNTRIVHVCTEKCITLYM